MYNPNDYIYENSNTICINKEIDNYVQFLENILNGINDIIIVYSKDHTIAFLNNAAKKLHEKNFRIKDFILFSNSQSSIETSIKKVFQDKKAFSTERYVPELNMYMDICYSAVLNSSDEVIFVIERSRDITLKKTVFNIVKEKEEENRELINLSPDALIIINDNNIVLANEKACVLFDTNFDEFIENNIYKYIPSKLAKTFHKRIRSILMNKTSKVTYEHEFNYLKGKVIYAEITSSYITYRNRPAILSIIRDITDTKKDLLKASEFQKSYIQKSFPLSEKAIMESVYSPANMVSGDFFHIYRITDDLAIGFLIDVSGKGIKAALSISAFELLLYEEIFNNHDPSQIIKNLNTRLLNYPRENYIAAMCFSMDFNKKEFTIVSAGINQFVFMPNNKQLEEITIKGTFLGMFEDSIFDKKVIPFDSGDRFYLFTDGLDFILDEDKVIENYMQSVNIDTFKNYINEFLNDTIIELGSLKDDCTMIALEIK